MRKQPSPVGWLPFGDGVEAFLRRHAGECWFYGSGKVALADSLAGAVGPGENVLLPAYLPDAVPEPFRELGAEVRFYAVTERLRPDLADLEARLDGDTTAVLSVDYFGFPQREFGAIGDLTRRQDCLHVEDSSHSAFSVVDGRLLGTRGDAGFTSLYKQLPVPNGACLFLGAEGRARGVGPSSFAGHRERFSTDDGRYLLRSVARRVAGARGCPPGRRYGSRN